MSHNYHSRGYEVYTLYDQLRSADHIRILREGALADLQSTEPRSFVRQSNVWSRARKREETSLSKAH